MATPGAIIAMVSFYGVKAFKISVDPGNLHDPRKFFYMQYMIFTPKISNLQGACYLVHHRFLTGGGTSSPFGRFGDIRIGRWLVVECLDPARGFGVSDGTR